MNPEQQRIIAAMEREWPRWQVWVVNRVVGGPVWCARPWDDEKHVLNAGSPDQLAEYLEQAVLSTPPAAGDRP